MMTAAVLAAALLTAALIHEAAHALALRKLGIPISEAGLGLPFPPKATFKPRRLPFALTFSPWLVGAYVMPHPDHHKEIDNLPYRKRAWFLNAGVISNIIAGLVFWAIGFAITGELAAFTVAAILASAVWFARKPIAAFLLPVLSVPLLIWTGSLIGQSWSQGESGFGFAAMTDAVPQASAVRYLAFFGTLNFAIAAMNTLPLFGLDNGKVVADILRRWIGDRATRVYEYAGLALVGLSVVAALASDLWAGAVALFT